MLSNMIPSCPRMAGKSNISKKIYSISGFVIAKLFVVFFIRVDLSMWVYQSKLKKCFAVGL